MRDRLVLSINEGSKASEFNIALRLYVQVRVQSAYRIPIPDATVDSSSARAPGDASPAQTADGEGDGHACQAARAQAGGKPTEQIRARGGTVVDRKLIV